MEKQKMIGGFNGWMDEYIRNPQKFMEDQQCIHRHLLEKAEGKTLTYGELCEATLTHYANIEPL